MSPLGKLLRGITCESDEIFYSLYIDKPKCPGICRKCGSLFRVDKEAKGIKCPACGKNSLTSGINLIIEEVKDL